MSEEMNNHNGMTPYETIKVTEMNRRGRVSGVGIAGLATGAVALFAGVGAWIYANSQAKRAQEVAAAKNDGLRDLVGSLATTVAAERNERIEGDKTLSISINDTVSGQQASNLTAQQQAELAASQVATQTVMTGLMTGRYSENPQQVVLMSGRRECPCPASGCGCNG
ncbi:MAG: hypothetical protein K6F72_00150 [Bacteroidales bacterium]|nr:hypothetical protein [Bacteroidales bacterium]